MLGRAIGLSGVGMMRHLLEIDDLSESELRPVLDLAERPRPPTGCWPGRAWP